VERKGAFHRSGEIRSIDLLVEAFRPKPAVFALLDRAKLHFSKRLPSRKFDKLTNKKIEFKKK